MEPWDHIKDCQAGLDYVQAHPKLWHLLEPSLLANEALSFKFAEPVAWWKTQKTYVESPPLTRERAEQIAHAIMAKRLETKHSMYCMLGMPITPDMHTEHHALAAGDMDDTGEELKYKSCIKGPDKDHWIKASIKEFHKLFTQYDTMRPIKLANIPEHKKKFITYYNPQCKTKIKPDGNG
jgi:hypothetical protein